MTFEYGAQQEPKHPLFPAMQPVHQQAFTQGHGAALSCPSASFSAGPVSDPGVLQGRMDLMSHWADDPEYHAAPPEAKSQRLPTAPGGPAQGADSTLTHEPDAWWRFTYPAFAMPDGKHDIFHPVRHFDSGSAALNLPVNVLHSLGNLAAIPFNALGALTALPEDAVRALGGSEQDVQAANFAMMMTGLGEVNLATEAVQGMRAASELNTLGKAAETSLVGEELAKLRLATPELETAQGSLQLATKPSHWYEVGHSAAGGQIGNFHPQMAHQVGGPAHSANNPITQTLQVFQGGWSTRMASFFDKKKIYETLSLPSSGENAAKAIAYHRAMQRLSSVGEYDVVLNSCSSNARDILQAGGLDIPFWARSPELLKLWFKMQGAK